MKDKTRNYLIEQLGSDDSNLITEIYAEFLSAFERNLRIAEKSFDGGDAEGLVHAAHTIKGDAAIVGENEVRDLALALQNAGKTNSAIEIKLNLEKLGNALADLLNEK